jgi:kynurenine formamidase
MMRLPTETEVQSYFKTLSNWGRWSSEDERGTLNLITPEKVRSALSLVETGDTVSCAWPIPRMRHHPGLMVPVLHFMIESGDGWNSDRKLTLFPPGMQGAADWVGMMFHGYGITHVDSPAHIFHEGRMYNGWPAECVSTHYGATRCGVDLMHMGVVTRGVLLDIPLLRGISFLGDGEPIYPDDLDGAERLARVRVQRGDLLFVRTGFGRRRRDGQEPGVGTVPGLHASCLPWLRERDVAVLGSDGINDVLPSGYEGIPMPIHQVGIVAMGLWLVDNADLEDLASVCQRMKRWQFLIFLSPVRLTNATGSPVNPIAVF